jgi:hypothetical protein
MESLGLKPHSPAQKFTWSPCPWNKGRLGHRLTSHVSRTCHHPPRSMSSPVPSPDRDRTLTALEGAALEGTLPFPPTPRKKTLLHTSECTWKGHLPELPVAQGSPRHQKAPKVPPHSAPMAQPDHKAATGWLCPQEALGAPNSHPNNRPHTQSLSSDHCPPQQVAVSPTLAQDIQQRERRPRRPMD